MNGHEPAAAALAAAQATARGLDTAPLALFRHASLAGTHAETCVRAIDFRRRVGLEQRETDILDLVSTADLACSIIERAAALGMQAQDAQRARLDQEATR